MTIKTTLGALSGAVPALSALMGEKLPIGAAVKVSLLAKKINAELEVFNEQRAKLFKEYGLEKAGDTVAPARLAEFNTKADELYKCSVEIGVDALTLDQLKAASITPQDVIFLVDAGLLDDQQAQAPPPP